MRNKKRVFVDFAFFDRTGIQQFLEKQARKGWMVKKAKGSFWLFERIEPHDVHFSVNYFPDAPLQDEEVSQQQKVYLDLCEYSGWARIETISPMQIFYNESKHPLPIETDPLLELETIHKATKKVYLRPRVYYLMMGLFYILLYIRLFSIDPMEAKNDKYYLSRGLYGLGMVLWSLFEILQYYVWRNKARRAAKLDGSFVETKSYPFVTWIIMIGWITPMLTLMIADLGEAVYFVAIAVLIYGGVLIAIRSMMGVKSEKYQILQLVVLMLCFIVVGAFFAFVLIGTFLPVLQEIYS